MQRSVASASEKAEEQTAPAAEVKKSEDSNHHTSVNGRVVLWFYPEGEEPKGDAVEVLAGIDVENPPALQEAVQPQNEIAPTLNRSRPRTPEERQKLWEYATDSQKLEAQKIRETARAQNRRLTREEFRLIGKIERSIKIPADSELLSVQNSSQISARRERTAEERQTLWEHATDAQKLEAQKIHETARAQNRRLTREEVRRIREIGNAIVIPASTENK